MSDFAFIICSQDIDLRNTTNEWIDKFFPNAQIIFKIDANSIFKAYNEGIDELEDRIEYVCFCHEDLDVQSINIRQLEKKLNTPYIGFVGAAGAKKLGSHGQWWNGYEGKPHENLSGKAGHQKLENNPNKPLEQYTRRWYNHYGAIGPVEVLDGVILFCRKDLLEKIRFDEEHFDGWDFYDITITWLANLKGYTNITFGGMTFYHWGLGNPRDTWDDNRKKFLEWKEEK